MIILHHLEYSQSFRVLWLLEELGVEYELKKYNRNPETHLAPEEYKKLSPLGTAPVITHNNLVLAETGAIVEYILDLYPNPEISPPAHSPNRVQHLFWFHAAQGSMMPLILMEALFQIIQEQTPSILNIVIRPVLAKASQGFIKTRMDKLLEKAEEDLRANDWFGGKALTTADILLSYPIEAASMRGYLSDDYPNTRAWLQRIYNRPAFQSAKDKDGRSSMALPL